MTAPRFSRVARLKTAEQNNPSLKRGETSDGVRVLQEALIDQGFPMPKSKPSPGANADGVFGAETEAAVSAFQKRERLTIDGVAGRQTLGRLDQLFNANDPFFGTPSPDDPKAFAFLTPSSRSRA
jgi:peptidoglycan hydrolase-like protein with peptidoglycan-binding domain